MFKFKTLPYGTEIQAVEIRKETARHVVLLHGQREAKFSSAYQCGFFDTWEEAHKSLLRRATDRRQIMQKDLGRINAEIDAINKMACNAALEAAR